MIMKRILYYIWILPLMLSGCEKDLMDYEGLEGVYFAVQWGDSWGSEKTWPYQPYTNVNFISLLICCLCWYQQYTDGQALFINAIKRCIRSRQRNNA